MLWKNGEDDEIKEDEEEEEEEEEKYDEDRTRWKEDGKKIQRRIRARIRFCH